MLIENLVKSLDGKPIGNGFKCKCPVHSDAKASLSVKLSDSGAVLLYCHAGCSYEEVSARLRWLGLLPTTRKKYKRKK